MDIEKYEEVVNAAKLLLKAEKEVKKKSERRSSMSRETHTIRAIALVTDNLTDACWQRDKAIDVLHKYLADAHLTSPKPKEDYEERIIEHTHGAGHTYKFKYAPPLPECHK